MKKEYMKPQMEVLKVYLSSLICKSFTYVRMDPNEELGVDDEIE